MRRLMIAAVVFGLALTACSAGEEFVFGADDLCDWVSEDTVTELAREAYRRSGLDWDGTAVLADETSNYECQWMLSGSDGEITVESWPVSSFSGELVAYEDLETDWIDLGPTVTGHPDFDEDVLISNGAFGRYGFWVPGMDDALVLSVYVNLDYQDEGDWETPLFVLARGFLDEMNWTS